jgi:hypothetical protein
MHKFINNVRKITYSSKKVTEIPERPFPEKTKLSDLLGPFVETGS